MKLLLLLTTLVAQTAAPQPFESPGVCRRGEKRACECTSQQNQSLPGIQRCAVGQWASCGCAEEWPYLGPTCGDTQCTPLKPDAGGYDGQHCCTPTGACGLSSSEAFGTRPLCLEVGAYPSGIEDNTACGLEIPFVETVSCCRPDNTCGLRLAYANWDKVGCIERTEFRSYLERNLVLRFFLALSNFSFEDISAQQCQFGG